MNLYIRTDLSAQIGTGHVMRCLALAQAWQNAGGKTVFVMATESALLESRLKSEGMEVTHLLVQPGSTDDANRTAELANEKNATWLVVDGYHFGVDYQRTIKLSGLRLLSIDDFGGADHYHADIVLNPNFDAHEHLYSRRASYTRLLLGARYVLLRREFLTWQRCQREIPAYARNILITLGGADPDNTTMCLIRALKRLEPTDLQIRVVVGPENTCLEPLHREVDKSPFGIKLLHSVNNMADLMAWADMAIIAAGGTLWEVLYMGCPTISYVRNSAQDRIIHELHELGIVEHQGFLNNIDQARLAYNLQQVAISKVRRQHMNATGRRVIDGEGTNRIVKVLFEDGSQR